MIKPKQPEFDLFQKAIKEKRNPKKSSPKEKEIDFTKLYNIIDKIYQDKKALDKIMNLINSSQLDEINELNLFIRKCKKHNLTPQEIFVAEFTRITHMAYEKGIDIEKHHVEIVQTVINNLSKTAGIIWDKK